MTSLLLRKFVGHSFDVDARGTYVVEQGSTPTSMAQIPAAGTVPGDGTDEMTSMLEINNIRTC